MWGGLVWLGTDWVSGVACPGLERSACRKVTVLQAAVSQGGLWWVVRCQPVSQPTPRGATLPGASAVGPRGTATSALTPPGTCVTIFRLSSLFCSRFTSPPTLAHTPPRQLTSGRGAGVAGWQGGGMAGLGSERGSGGDGTQDNNESDGVDSDDYN